MPKIVYVAFMLSNTNAQRYNMKIKELLPYEYIYKLKEYTFHNRQLNKDVLNYYKKALNEYEFVEREVNKIKENYKTEIERHEQYKQVDEIEFDSIQKFKLKDSDFDECFLPQDKSYILTEEKIQRILEWCEK